MMAKAIPATPMIPAAIPPTSAPVEIPEEGVGELEPELAAPVALLEWLTDGRE
jgi:hypothetical protein